MTWTKERLAQFKAAYEQAVKDEQFMFMFLGHEFVTGYAKYLIEHLENEFK